MEPARKNKTLLLLSLICIVAILLRVVTFFWAYRQNKVEVFDYEVIATNLIHGEGFILPRFNTIYRTAIAPVYPFICAAIYYLFGHKIAYVVYFQILMSALLCIVIFLIGKRIFNEKVGLLAALLVGFHPGLIVYSSLKLVSLVAYSFFMCAITLMIFKTYDRPSLFRQILLGIFFGIGILERPTVLIYLLLSFFWFFCYFNDKKYALKIIRRITLIVAIILLPWIIRSYFIYKSFVFIQTNQWEALWIGNNPNASGTVYLADGRTMLEASTPEFRKELFSLDELGQGRLFRMSALQYIKENPLRFLKLTCKRFFYFWWFWPQTGILYPHLWLVLYKYYYVFMLSLALFGVISLARSKPLRKFIILIGALFFAIAFAQSFYYAEARHRWSVESLMLIFSAGGLIFLSDAFRNIKNVRGLPKY